MTVGSRQPAVAGLFYEADPAALERQLDAAFAAARRPAPDAAEPAPEAVVAPHAGYVYSGPVAASAYLRLAPLRGLVERVVLVGPAHRARLRGLAATAADRLVTPLGDVAVDRRAREAVAGLPGVVVDDRPHEGEHSLEVHLPFILRVLGDVPVLPLAVGRAAAGEVAAVLDRVWGGRETVVVVSSDLSHYSDHTTATALDRRTAAAIEALDAAAVGPADACGASAVAGLLLVAARRGLAVRAVDLRTSGDTAGGRDRVVGYGAFVAGRAAA